MNRIILIVFFIIFISCNEKQTKTENSDIDLRIVSLTPSVTEELIDLQLSKNIVGATSYCKISKDNKDLIVGSAIDVNIEKILLLKPDVVFVNELIKESVIKTLESGGVKIYRKGKSESFDDICNQFIELGKYIGKEELAKQIVIDSKRKVDSLKLTVQNRCVKRKMLIQIGADPIFTVLPKTYMNDFITMANCENISNDLTSGTITRESVLLRNPDIIFVVTMGVIGNEEKQNWEKFKELNAAKDKMIFLIDSEYACSPTVLSFTKTLEEIIKVSCN